MGIGKNAEGPIRVSQPLEALGCLPHVSIVPMSTAQTAVHLKILVISISGGDGSDSARMGRLAFC